MLVKILLQIVLMAACTAVGGYAGYKLGDNFSARVATIDEPIVMRTKGGLLEVSTISATERFDGKTTHTILGLELGNTFSNIRVPVTYRYHIELAPDWRFALRDKTFVVVAPPVKPSLPVAIDTSKLENESHGIWSLVTGRNAIEKLQRGITPTLAEYAKAQKYIDLQRASARQTVGEFVKKWVMSQEKWAKASNYQVRVFFADEPIQAMRDSGYVPGGSVGTTK